MTPKQRIELGEKLVRLVEWLDASPNNGLNDRRLEIEVNVSTSHRATVDLHSGWIAMRPGQSIDDAPLGSRHYGAEGRSLIAALGRLHVPRIAKPRRPR